MSETVNIAALAQSVATRIFNVFGWEMEGLQDENFPCSKAEKHQTKSVGSTHPVDCVFSYPDPFSTKQIYLIFDLKSYASSTIKTTDFAPYIRGLSKTIDCARVSDPWQKRYVSSEITDWHVEGSLFVYNHDGNYDKSFKEKAKGLAPSSLSHGITSRIHLFCPDDISYLESIAQDMKSYCGEHDLKFASRKFFFAQQLIHTPRDSLLPIATIEMLRGQILIVAFEKSDHQFNYIVYLRGVGTEDEFEYLITYLFRNGIMSLTRSVLFKGANFGSDAQVDFDKARSNFWVRHYKMPEIWNSLECIKFDRVSRVTNNFSSVDESKRRQK